MAWNLMQIKGQMRQKNMNQKRGQNTMRLNMIVVQYSLNDIHDQFNHMAVMFKGTKFCVVQNRKHFDC